MADIPSNLWVGKSGKKYRYWIYDYTQQFPKKPGNFIITRMNSSAWLPLYAGHTNSLSSLKDHVSDCISIEQSFPTHIHIHYNFNSEVERQKEVYDLQAQYDFMYRD